MVSVLKQVCELRYNSQIISSQKGYHAWIGYLSPWQKSANLKENSSVLRWLPGAKRSCLDKNSSELTHAAGAIVVVLVNGCCGWCHHRPPVVIFELNFFWQQCQLMTTPSIVSIAHQNLIAGVVAENYLWSPLILRKSFCWCCCSVDVFDDTSSEFSEYWHRPFFVGLFTS